MRLRCSQSCGLESRSAFSPPLYRVAPSETSVSLSLSLPGYSMMLSCETSHLSLHNVLSLPDLDGRLHMFEIVGIICELCGLCIVPKMQRGRSHPLRPFLRAAELVAIKQHVVSTICCGVVCGRVHHDRDKSELRSPATDKSTSRSSQAYPSFSVVLFRGSLSFDEA